MTRSNPESERDASIPPDVRVRIERYDESPDVCTIFDASVPRRLSTTWISAEEGSYVALEDAQ